MPKVKVNDITMNYEQQGTGDALILIPFLTADNACYAFQVAEYAKHFTCISLDLRGTGQSEVIIRQRFSPTTLPHSCEH
jgi:pimeloyl-ACP methyl ester carboxylesterase